MDWYYSEDGEQRGPVSQQQFDQLTLSGVVSETTLVWREGLSSWKPYSTLAGKAEFLASGNSGWVVCVECGLRLPREETVQFEKANVCASCKPKFLQRIREGVPLFGSAVVWRSGRDLVTPLEVTFPQRCLKCNGTAEGGPIQRKLYWHSPLVYVALPISILIYAIIALAVRKRGVAFVSICPAHRASRRNALMSAWFFGVGGFVVMIVGIAKESHWVGVGGGAGLLVGLIYGFVRGRLIMPKKIDQERMFLRGCGEAFLASFPEWTGPK